MATGCGGVRGPVGREGFEEGQRPRVHGCTGLARARVKLGGRTAHDQGFALPNAF